MEVKTLAILLILAKSSDSHAANILTVDGAKFAYTIGVLTVDKTALERLREILIEDEGVELMPYHDSLGHLTIGVGRNLVDVGISEREAMILLDNDIKRVLLETQHAYLWFDKLNAPRQVVILSMVFNMGITGFAGFKKMIMALEKSDYNKACREMLDSQWAKQVGERAKDLSLLMKLGRF